MPCSRLLIIILLVPLSACSPAPSGTRTPSKDLARIELESMLESDQALRAEIQAIEGMLGAKSPQAKDLWVRQSRADQQNVKQLIQYVESNGWPSPSIVGEKAATAAFLVLQHADLQVQQKLLPLLRASAANNEFKPHRLAMLEDRIAVRTGKAQLYGTQLDSSPWHSMPRASDSSTSLARPSSGSCQNPIPLTQALDLGFPYLAMG